MAAPMPGTAAATTTTTTTTTASPSAAPSEEAEPIKYPGWDQPTAPWTTTQLPNSLLLPVLLHTSRRLGCLRVLAGVVAVAGYVALVATGRLRWWAGLFLLPPARTWRVNRTNQFHQSIQSIESINQFNQFNQSIQSTNQSIHLRAHPSFLNL